MNNENNKKKEPWRIVAFIMGIIFIIYMWVKNDIISIYTTMPREQVVPLIVTTLAVTLIKVAVIAGGLFLIKWGIGKIANK